MPAISLNFLERHDLYKEEKPYVLTFKPPDGFPSTNVKLDLHEDVEVYDIRGRENEFSIDQNGFALMKLNSQLSYKDFGEDEIVSKIYLKEVADALIKRLGASQVQIFEHVIRRRHEIFPISTGESYEYNQPTSIAHIDTTPEWTKIMAERLNPSKAPDRKSRLQCVNVWKPLRGPLQDWPLGLCDFNTVRIKDVHAGDLVHANFVLENCQVHYSPEQKWYYISNQEPSEAWVFIQSDSKDAWKRPGVPHSAFPYPQTIEGALPRESIEIRCLVWYDE